MVIADEVDNRPVTAIAKNAFKNAQNTMKSLKIGKNIKTIDEGAIRDCVELVSLDLGDGVEEIGQLAFCGSINLEKITFGKSLKTIGALAFDQCYKLEKLEFPDNVVTIDTGAFEECPCITEVKFGSGLETIGVSAFRDSKKITKVELNEGLKELGAEAFSDASLTVFEVPASITKLKGCPVAIGADQREKYFPIKINNPDCALEEIWNGWNRRLIVAEKDSAVLKFAEENSLRYCTFEQYESGDYDDTGYAKLTYEKTDGGLKVTEVYTANGVIAVIPDEVDGVPVVAVGNKAFSGSDIISLKLGKNVTTIGEAAFEKCEYLTKVELNDGLKEIGNSAFYLCRKLDSITGGSGLEAIGKDAFNDCFALKEFKTGEKLKSVGRGAFGRTSLKELVLPETVTELDGCPFGQDELDEKFDYAVIIKNKECKSTLYGTASKDWESCLIVCAEGSPMQEFAEQYDIRFCTYEQYENGEYGEVELSYFDENTALRQYGVSYVKVEGGAQLSKVRRFDEDGALVIPDEVEGIPVVSIDPEALTKVPFDLKSELVTLKIGKNVKAIPDEAFKECGALKTVILGDGIETIGSCAFQDCNKLTALSLGEGLKEIGDHAFFRCYNLKEVKLPDSLTSLGSGAFECCYSLKKVNVPEKIKRIEMGTFSGTSIEEIVFPESVEYIASSAVCMSVTATETIIPAATEADGTTTSPMIIASEESSDCCVTILNPKCEIESNAFAGVVKICGYTGSTAEKYAAANDIEFVSLDENKNAYLAGDTNCDGVVDLADAVLIMQSLANPNKYGEYGTDARHLTAQGKINGDVDKFIAGITANDALRIQEYLLGKLTSLDAE